MSSNMSRAAGIGATIAKIKDLEKELIRWQRDKQENLGLLNQRGLKSSELPNGQLKNEKV